MPGLASSLLDGQADARVRQRAFASHSAFFLNRLPSTLHEREYDAKSFDKVFAAEWVDDSHVLMGTKCNRLLLLDTECGSIVEKPLPETPERPWAAPPNGWGPCGIHAVKINPARDMVATGGRDPTDTVVLRLSDYSPVQTLMGHMDWVFGLAWCSDRHILTGSRDQSVALWTLPDVACAAEDEQPKVQMKRFEDKRDMKRKFNGKVRDVAYCPQLCRAAVLDTSGCVKLLDPARDLATSRIIKLQHKQELVCLAVRPDAVAVGSAAHVTLADPRSRTAAHAVVPSPDDQQGVRSVCLRDHLLSFGTGRGKLCFWDMRVQAFLPTEPLQQYGYGPGGLQGKLSSQPQPVLEPRHHLQTGPGWLLQNEVYYEHFSGLDICNACYALAWCPRRARLFAAGGPLAFGLKGCYSAMWQ